MNWIKIIIYFLVYWTIWIAFWELSWKFIWSLTWLFNNGSQLAWELNMVVSFILEWIGLFTYGIIIFLPIMWDRWRLNSSINYFADGITREMQTFIYDKNNLTTEQKNQKYIMIWYYGLFLTAITTMYFFLIRVWKNIPNGLDYFMYVMIASIFTIKITNFITSLMAAIDSKNEVGQNVVSEREALNKKTVFIFLIMLIFILLLSYWDNVSTFFADIVRKIYPFAFFDWARIEV